MEEIENVINIVIILIFGVIIFSPNNSVGERIFTQMFLQLYSDSILLITFLDLTPSYLSIKVELFSQVCTPHWATRGS